MSSLKVGMLFVCLFIDGQKIIYKQDVKRETANNSRSAIKSKHKQNDQNFTRCGQREKEKNSFGCIII